MTRSLAAAVTAALQAGTLVPRDFLWIVARNRTTGAPEAQGFWSDLGGVTADVIDPATGATQSRAFVGAGDLIGVSDVRLVTGLVVQTVTVTLSQISAAVEDQLRTHDLRRARVELFRGFMDPVSLLLVSPAVPRFVGFVDDAQVNTPAEGGEGGVVLTVASHVQELTRTSAAKRSDADQRRRSATDGFYRHAATVGTWQIRWGQE